MQFSLYDDQPVHKYNHAFPPSADLPVCSFFGGFSYPYFSIERGYGKENMRRQKKME